MVFFVIFANPLVGHLPFFFFFLGIQIVYKGVILFFFFGCFGVFIASRLIEAFSHLIRSSVPLAVVR